MLETLSTIGATIRIAPFLPLTRYTPWRFFSKTQILEKPLPCPSISSRRNLLVRPFYWSLLQRPCLRHIFVSVTICEPFASALVCDDEACLVTNRVLETSTSRALWSTTYWHSWVRVSSNIAIIIPAFFHLKSSLSIIMFFLLEFLSKELFVVFNFQVWLVMKNNNRFRERMKRSIINGLFCNLSILKWSQVDKMKVLDCDVAFCSEVFGCYLLLWGQQLTFLSQLKYHKITSKGLTVDTVSSVKVFVDYEKALILLATP